MSTTGDIIGTNIASTTGGGSGSEAWSNISNALTDNASAATCFGSFRQSNWLHMTNFGFAIPTDATINGITVKFRRKCSSTNDWFTQQVRLVHSGVQLGTLKTPGYTYWTTTATVETHGGISDLWGWTPVIATINSSTFGIQVWAEDDSSASETASIECMWLNITYTPAAGGSPVNTSRHFFKLAGGRF